MQNQKGMENEIMKNQLKKEMEDNFLIKEENLKTQLKKELEDKIKKEMEANFLIKEENLKTQFKKEMEVQNNKLLRFEQMIMTLNNQNISKAPENINKENNQRIGFTNLKQQAIAPFSINMK